MSMTNQILLFGVIPLVAFFRGYMVAKKGL